MTVSQFLPGDFILLFSVSVLFLFLIIYQCIRVLGDASQKHPIPPMHFKQMESVIEFMSDVGPRPNLNNMQKCQNDPGWFYQTVPQITLTWRY